MIKFVQCVTRKPGMESIAFQSQWREYGRHVEDLARDRPNVLRIRLSTTLTAAGVSSDSDGLPPYDGMLELWLNDATVASGQRDLAMKRWMAELSRVLPEFVDEKKSTAFFATEDMGFDRQWSAEETVRQF